MGYCIFTFFSDDYHFFMRNDSFLGVFIKKIMKKRYLVKKSFEFSDFRNRVIVAFRRKGILLFF